MLTLGRTLSSGEGAKAYAWHEEEWGNLKLGCDEPGREGKRKLEGWAVARPCRVF